MKRLSRSAGVGSGRGCRGLAVAALGIAIAIATREARAGKPPAEPPPPGVVYFSSNTPEGSQDLYSMLGDGSHKTLVFQDFFDEVLNTNTCPSQLPHGGARWFLKFTVWPTGWAGDAQP